jgi:mevalonate kinase
MKGLIRIAVAIAVLTFILALAGSAQQEKMKADTAKMGEKIQKKEMAADTAKAMGQMEMMAKMSSHYDAMLSDYGKLHEHFNQMMQMADMTQLKEEMKKHQKMMEAMHVKMTEHQKMCKKMVPPKEERKKVEEE